MISRVGRRRSEPTNTHTHALMVWEVGEEWLFGGFERRGGFGERGGGVVGSGGGGWKGRGRRAN